MRESDNSVTHFAAVQTIYIDELISLIRDILFLLIKKRFNYYDLLKIMLEMLFNISSDILLLMKDKSSSNEKQKKIFI
jgi:hypothetical protein